MPRTAVRGCVKVQPTPKARAASRIPRRQSVDALRSSLPRKPAQLPEYLGRESVDRLRSSLPRKPAPFLEYHGRESVDALRSSLSGGEEPSSYSQTKPSCAFVTCCAAAGRTSPASRSVSPATKTWLITVVGSPQPGATITALLQEPAFLQGQPSLF
jgi:hypothetical protein